MTKYTTKWTTRGALDIIEDIHDPSRPDYEQPVRLVATACGRGLDENMANARLIAAAPELYNLAAELASLPDEQCMISPIIHEARRLLARIDGKKDTDGE